MLYLMNNKSVFLVFLMVCAAALPSFAQQIISVSSYGIKPNTFVDATSDVKAAIEACNAETATTLVFPKGRYDFWPEHADVRNYYISNTSTEQECPSKLKTIGLLFEKKKNLTIEGNGSLFVFHGKMVTWAMDHCENIVIQNIQVDFERPTMSEMTFREVSDSLVIADIHPDSKYAIINGRLNWYGEGWGMNGFHAVLVDPKMGTEFYSSWDPFAKSEAQEVAPFKVRFKGNFSNTSFKPGQVLTIRDPVRDQVGAFINLSKNISVKNVSMYYMHGLGIVNQFSENLHYDSVFVMPRPGSGRVISSFADCMHFSGCKGQVTIENCKFKGAHDDPINVHGTHLEITQIISPTTIKVRFMHPQTYGFEAFFVGDSVAFVHSAKLQIFGSGVISSAKLISKQEMLLELKGPLSPAVATGDCLENLTWTPSLTIKNCRFESTITRGLLVTTRRKVLIENNTFYRTGMHAILIANDASSWYESGEVQDVTIRNNIFQECGYNSSPGNYVIAIAPENHELVPGYMVHKNIRIENNTFIVYDYPLLSVRSTENLIFTRNTILWTKDFMAPQGKPRAAFLLTACKKVSILKNEFKSSSRPSILLQGMAKKELKADSRALTVQENKDN
jgi:hypothetical protein